MGKKYFTLSFDDGLEQDKRVIRLMRQYGFKGTFNLNAGLLGTRGEVKGLGTFSFQDCPEGVKHKWPFFLCAAQPNPTGRGVPSL